ncbi:hypothetical protein G3I34_13200 [Streptomyces sp. SID8014]|nr:hypothetical protein [Streptomyces sp. SID8014]
MSGARGDGEKPSEPGRPVHVTVWDDGGAAGSGTRPPVVYVHAVLTWGDDPRHGSAARRPLAAACSSWTTGVTAAAPHRPTASPTRA